MGHGRCVFIPPDIDYSNVIRLRLENSTLKSLPEHVVLKKETDEEHFNTELRIYDELKSLQGTHIPTLFGVAIIDDTRALVMSDVGGIPLVDEKMIDMDEDTLRRLLRIPLQKIGEAGVLLEDVSMLNVHFVNGFFVILDFDVARIESQRDTDSDVSEQVEDIIDHFRIRRMALRIMNRKHKVF